VESTRIHSNVSSTTDDRDAGVVILAWLAVPTDDAGGIVDR